MFRKLTAYRSVACLNALTRRDVKHRLRRPFATMQPRVVCDAYVHNAFLSDAAAAPHSPLQLIVLNYVLPSTVQTLWNRSKIFGDGGANRFFDLLPQLNPELDPLELRAAYLPDAICGDLDSIRPEVLQFYKSLDVPIRDLSHDQDSTDTDKCIAYLRERHSGEAEICVVGSLGGRLDHTLANLHSLYTYANLQIVMMGEGNCARLLKSGKTKIRVDPEVEGPKCALVPLNGPVTVSATGLRWPLDGHALKFDGLISTSNLMISDVIMVEASAPVLWITRLSKTESHLGS